MTLCLASIGLLLVVDPVQQHTLQQPILSLSRVPLTPLH
ncbi:hypothetical protein [Klebsiella aerogenes EA1509E]|nr:hypothetical protein [Klebsiella aerogenes EA1509E]